MEHTLLLYKIFIPTFVSFALGFFLTPFFTRIFYKYKLWKRSSRIDPKNKGKFGEMSDDFKKVYNPNEVKTPRVGGVIVWVTVILVFLVFSILSQQNWMSSQYFHILTRNQTLIPFISLLLGAGLGLVDDLLQIFGNEKYLKIGVPRWLRISFVLFLGFVEGVCFYHKLGYTQLNIPFLDLSIHLGALFILFYIFVMLALFSSSVIDGIDGLAGGVLAIIFATYGFIGIIQHQYNIAAFAFIVFGALLSFLWFNIPPARFYLGESGILALTLSLSVLIFLTHTEFEFLLIGFPLVITSASSFIQIISRRFFGKKVFRIAPFHHHLEALGWSRERVTMRYWVFGVISAVLGLIIVILK